MREHRFIYGVCLGVVAGFMALVVDEWTKDRKLPEYKGHKVRTIKQDTMTYHILLKGDSVLHISHNQGFDPEKQDQ